MLEKLRCKVVGHKVGRKSVFVSPAGTSQDGRCMRCGTRLVREDGAWRESLEVAD